MCGRDGVEERDAGEHDGLEDAGAVSLRGGSAKKTRRSKAHAFPPCFVLRLLSAEEKVGPKIDGQPPVARQISSNELNWAMQPVGSRNSQKEKTHSKRTMSDYPAQRKPTRHPARPG